MIIDIKTKRHITPPEIEDLSPNEQAFIRQGVELTLSFGNVEKLRKVLAKKLVG